MNWGWKREKNIKRDNLIEEAFGVREKPDVRETHRIFLRRMIPAKTPGSNEDGV